MDARASLPAIGRLLATADGRALVSAFGKAATTVALRDAVNAAREGRMTRDAIVPHARTQLEAARRGTLVPVLNASGVLLHTNLGRARLCDDARSAVARQGSGYASLELDLGTGERGSRHVHAAARLRRLTGAEDALVANNAAAALLLALSAVATRGSVIVSRGELVEIGGEFRIPEIVTAGGAKLVEVGTTNRTRIADFARALDALGEPAGSAILTVHRSNFAIVGFTESVPLEALVALGRGREPSIPVVYDLGSGLMVPGRTVGIPDEPDVPSAVATGADVVIFSGDKLLGGPQAGLAVGRKGPIEAMRRHPLMRALRPGKLTLAALDATLATYERGDVRALPTLRMLGEAHDVTRARAEALRAMLGLGTVVDTIARVGGGAQPLAQIQSAAVRLVVAEEASLAAKLRAGDPVVIGRVEEGALLLDVRAITDEDLPALAMAVQAALG